MADEQDRLTGDELAKNMAEQISLLKEQVYWYEEKLKIQKEEAAEYRNTLASQYGITFNEEGFITNYKETYQRLLGELNGLIDQYNATTTESGQEALEAQIENAQDAFDKFSELVDNYDNLISNSIKESENQIEQFYDEMENLRIEAFNKAVEAVDNIKDIQETLVEFDAVFSGLNQDDPFRGMETSLQKLRKYWDVSTQSMAKYYSSLIEKNKELMQQSGISESQKKWLQYQNEMLQSGLAHHGMGTLEAGGTGYLDLELANLNAIMEQIRQFETTGTSSIFGEDSADLYETAKDIFDSATSMVNDYEDELEELKDNILDGIDEINDAINDRLDAFDRINDQLEHYISMEEMLHGEESYDNINQALAAQVENNKGQIEVLKGTIDILKDMQSVMEEGSEQWEAINEQIIDEQSQLLEVTESTMEAITSIYENNVNKYLDDTFGDLDWINDQWEMINRNADQYLDEVNSAYEIQKLQGKYLELLDGTNDLAIQKQITDQMNSQLNGLRSKNKLSQYEVDYANAQLEILQRTIALQEAQRNKSQLQLRRDTQGNYSYVYAANEGDVADAESNLLDAQNNAYNLSKEEIKNTQNNILSEAQSARDLMQSIMLDMSLTAEERLARVKEVFSSFYEYYQNECEKLGEASDNIIVDFSDMYDILLEANRANMDEVYSDVVAGNTNAFDQIDDRWSSSVTNWIENGNKFGETVDSVLGDMAGLIEDYDEKVNDLESSVGTNYEDITGSIQQAADATKDLRDQTKEFFNDLANDSGVVKDYEKNLQEMTAKIQSAESAMLAYKSQVDELGDKLTAKEQENTNLSNQVANLEAQIEAQKQQAAQQQQQQQQSNSSNGNGGAPVLKVGAKIGYRGSYYYDSAGKTPLGNLFAGEKGAVTIDSMSDRKYGGSNRAYGDYDVHINAPEKGYMDLGWIKASQAFDTGGYTGDFNDPSGAGRLAVLHSKELVLNESDTKNILAAVEAVRNLTTNFRNGAFEDAVEAISKYGGQMIENASMPQAKSIDQNVHIEASFPNANSATEIENALLNLNNVAAQYAFAGRN